MERKKSILAVILILVSSFAYAQEFTRKEATEDIKFAVKKLKKIHPDPFFRTSKKDFDTEVKKISDNLSDNNSSRHLQSEIARLLALVHDTHTRCRGRSDFSKNYWQAGGKIFPIYPRFEDDIVRVHGFFGGVDPNALGRIEKGHILATIDNVSIDCIIKKCKQYISGDSDYEKCTVLARHFYYYLWLLHGPRDTYELALVDDNGNEYTETVNTVAKKKEVDKKAESPNKTTHPFSYSFYQDSKACLFDAPSFGSSLWNTFSQTLDQCLNEMKQNQTVLLVVDLRKNGGGHSGLGQELLQKTINKPFKSQTKYNKSVYSLAFAFKQTRKKNWLSFSGTNYPIDSPWKGQVVLLCGPNTGSAAVSTAAMAKDNNIALIAGQETGGRPSAFMEIVAIELPNSKLKCDISTCYFLRPGGFDDGKGVLPDLPLDITLSNEDIIEEAVTHLDSVAVVK